MARIGLIDVDGGKSFPNLALMKISAWHKAYGDDVSWYNPFDGWYDDVYLSKVFSFTPDYDYCINATNVHRGGTGYCIDLVDGKEVYHKERDTDLPYKIEHMYPDYSLYPDLKKILHMDFSPGDAQEVVVSALLPRKRADVPGKWRI